MDKQASFRGIDAARGSTRALGASMLQLLPGDLVAIRNDGGYIVVAILTKQILFGGHWSYVFHGVHKNAPLQFRVSPSSMGFNVVVDFILPKREERLIHISRGNLFTAFLGPELVTQAPLRGEKNYRIWRWNDGAREDTTFVRHSPTPTEEERTSPGHGCLAADFAWQLATRGWTPGQVMYEAPNNRIERTRAP